MERSLELPKRSPALSTKQAAEYLGLSASTLEKWRLQGKGPAWKRLGAKLVRYPLPELEAFNGGGSVS